MARFVMLIRYTEIGISQIHRTVSRAEQFRSDAAALGVTVESVYWTMGEFDGVVIFTAADAETAIALATHLGGRGYVRTTLLPAFNQEEFGRALARMPAPPVED
jgi:uncharacterized protein with GYD domain